MGGYSVQWKGKGERVRKGVQREALEALEWERKEHESGKGFG